MHIKESLVYDKLTHIRILAFEKSFTDSKSLPLATTMMTFMVRGLFSHLQFPYAHFPCHKITGDLLYDPFWEAVYRLERCGFKVCYM